MGPDYTWTLEWAPHDRTYHIRFRSMTVAEMMTVQGLMEEQVTGHRALVVQRTRILDLVVEQITVDDRPIETTGLPVDAFWEVYSAQPIFRGQPPAANPDA